MDETDDENDELDLIQNKLDLNKETADENPNILLASPQISVLQASQSNLNTFNLFIKGLFTLNKCSLLIYQKNR